MESSWAGTHVGRRRRNEISGSFLRTKPELPLALTRNVVGGSKLKGGWMVWRDTLSMQTWRTGRSCSMLTNSLSTLIRAHPPTRALLRLAQVSSRSFLTQWQCLHCSFLLVSWLFLLDYTVLQVFRSNYLLHYRYARWILFEMEGNCSQVAKAEVCKTSIRRFESDRFLQRRPMEPIIFDMVSG